MPMMSEQEVRDLKENLENIAKQLAISKEAKAPFMAQIGVLKVVLGEANE